MARLPPARSVIAMIIGVLPVSLLSKDAQNRPALAFGITYDK